MAGHNLILSVQEPKRNEPDKVAAMGVCAIWLGSVGGWWGGQCIFLHCTPLGVHIECHMVLSMWAFPLHAVAE